MQYGRDTTATSSTAGPDRDPANLANRQRHDDGPDWQWYKLTNLMPEANGDGQRIYRTRALGTTAELWVTNGDALVVATQMLHNELERIDRVANRFRADSEITHLNLSAESDVVVSPDLLEAIAVALAMAEATGGAVDPTVGAALCRLGYVQDFATMATGVSGLLPHPEPVPGWRRIELNRAARTIRLPANTQLDLGATAKALAADKAAAHISAQVGCGVLVSLGGDVAVDGTPPPGGFSVGLADLCTSRSATEVVAIASGGLASSGINARQWMLGPDKVHHIIDPVTGLSASTCWRTVSVAAACCVQANAASTAAIVKGAAALDWLGSLHLPARLLDLEGNVTTRPRGRP